MQDDHLNHGKSTAHEESKQSAGIQISGGMPVAAGGTATWETTTSREVTGYASITGSIDLRGRNWGLSNCASWSLTKNKEGERGIPHLVKTAVLLRRDDDKSFRCILTIDATVDVRSRFERFFGHKDSLAKDDPVLFDPQRKATNNLQHYGQNNLGRYKLHELSEITFRTDVCGTVKEFQQRR